MHSLHRTHPLILQGFQNGWDAGGRGRLGPDWVSNCQERRQSRYEEPEPKDPSSFPLLFIHPPPPSIFSIRLAPPPTPEGCAEPALDSGYRVGTFDVDELLLGERLVVDRICPILCNVLLNESPLIHMIRDRGHAWMLWHFVGDCRESR